MWVKLWAKKYDDIRENKEIEKKPIKPLKPTLQFNKSLQNILVKISPCPIVENTNKKIYDKKIIWSVNLKLVKYLKTLSLISIIF